MPGLTSGGPLSHLRVIDLTRFVSGPWATMLLGDLGADVIKIEQPGSGDGSRRWDAVGMGRDNPYYMAVNRSKRSVAVDMKRSEGREVILDLVAQADVIVNNFRSGAMARLGLDYEKLRDRNPQIVACTITGYGDVGPDHTRPAFDFTVQAQSGLMSLNGRQTDPPMKVGIPVADLITASIAANAIQAALIQRGITGEGCEVSTSMFEAIASFFANVGSDWLIGGLEPPRLGNAHPNLAPYETFEVADGTIALGVATEEQWARLTKLIGRPELLNDPRFADNSIRLRERAALLAEIEPCLRTRTRAEWISLLMAEGIPCGEIRTMPEALASEQAGAIGLVALLEHPMWGPIKMVRTPMRFGSSAPQLEVPPPRLGEHTRVVLEGVLGYSAETVEQLAASGAVGLMDAAGSGCGAKPG